MSGRWLDLIKGVAPRSANLRATRDHGDEALLARHGAVTPKLDDLGVTQVPGLRRIPLAVHTNVAELLDQLRVKQVHAFGRDATFKRRVIKQRPYWYARSPMTAGDRTDRYLGPETPELLAAIAVAREAREGADMRRQIVQGLKGAGLPTPDQRTGRVLQALSEGGVFRLRGALVGTVAFQTYAALLGVLLPQSALRTSDLDIAQDYGVSLALDDEIDGTFLELLRTADPRLTPILTSDRKPSAARYRAPDGFSVDVLTTSRGSGEAEASKLKSLHTHATPLRHLDFLIRETTQAVVLFQDGVLVNVPSPQRYAVHKLIVSRRRGATNPKSRKDLEQAATLIDALSEIDPFALRAAYAEARERGPTWRELLDEAVQLLPPGAGESLG